MALGVKEFSALKRSFTQPLWDGSDLAGKTILLWAEQGLGDTIQFIRYAPLVKRRGGTVILECQPALLPLLRVVQAWIDFWLRVLACRILMFMLRC